MADSAIGCLRKAGRIALEPLGAVDATGGCPFRIQLIGYYMVAYANGSGEITSDHVRAGIGKAEVERQRLGLAP